MPTTSVRPVPRDSRVLRMLGRPKSRRWLLELAGRDEPDAGSERAELIRRLNRAIAAPGEPRKG